MKQHYGMDTLAREITALKRGRVGRLVESRMREFRETGRSFRSIFKEMCFCILTANYNAERAIKIQREIDDGFFTLPEVELAFRLKSLGYRYPNTRAGYIVEARRHMDSLKHLLNEADPRRWLAVNVRGLGYKEASHFLRNIGFGDYAIVDFHIVDLLERHNLIEKPKTLTRLKYLEVEEVLRSLACRLKMSLAELDLYLWYLETGKVLK